MSSEIIRFMNLLKMKFCRSGNVMYPSWFAEKMVDEAYEDFKTSNDKKPSGDGK